MFGLRTIWVLAVAYLLFTPFVILVPFKAGAEINNSVLLCLGVAQFVIFWRDAWEGLKSVAVGRYQLFSICMVLLAVFIVGDQAWFIAWRELGKPSWMENLPLRFYIVFSGILALSAMLLVPRIVDGVVPRKELIKLGLLWAAGTFGALMIILYGIEILNGHFR